MASLVQKLRPFSEGVDFAYCWSCIGKGLRPQPAQCAAGLFVNSPQPIVDFCGTWIMIVFFPFTHCKSYIGFSPLVCISGKGSCWPIRGLGR